MTAPSYPAPVPRSRPTIVTVASYLLYIVAVLEVINALLGFTTLGTVTEAVEDIYAGTEVADSAESITIAGFVIGSVINLLLAAGFAVLGLFNGKGKNVSRIITWVIGGISLCCVGAGLGGNALSGAMGGGGTTGGPSQTEVQQRLEDALPSWYTPLTTVTAVVVLLAILGALILLALPAANEFFRKPAPGFDPSQPYPAYPYPGQPYPGQAQPPYPPPGQFGQQGQPGQPAPGLSPYPGQPAPGQPAAGQPGQLPSYPAQTGPPGSPPPPPASDPFAPPPASDPFAQPPDSGDEPPKPPANPA